MSDDYGPYRAVVAELAYDGDTIPLNLDLGFRGYVLARNPLTNRRDWTCRLWGIDAPELKEPTLAAGLASRDFLRSLLPIGSKVKVISKSWDAYAGRFDGVILYGPNFDQSVADAMVQLGHAVYRSYT